MERLIKVVCIVAAVVMCSSSAMAYWAGNNAHINTDVPGDYGGNYWNVSVDWWSNDGTWVDETTTPTSADDVYEYNTYNYFTGGWYQHANIIAAGNTGYCNNYFLASQNSYAGMLIVEGSLEASGVLGYGNAGFAPALWYDGSHLVIADTGSASFAGLAVADNAPDMTQSIVVDGALSFAGDVATTGAVIDIDVTGTLAIGGVVTTAGASELTIDIASDTAALVMLQSEYNALQAAGSILAEGVVDASAIGMTDLGDGVGSYSLVPEPATMVLLGLGALVLRRKK